MPLNLVKNFYIFMMDIDLLLSCCYSLDPECPQRPLVKVWLPVCGIKRWRLEEEGQVTGDVPFSRTSAHPPLSLLPNYHEVSSSSVMCFVPAMMYCVTTAPNREPTME